jgi:CRISPR/Cas system CMR-associated protein Cmr5 small subunit
MKCLKYLLCLCCLWQFEKGYGQKPVTQFNGFGHLEYTLDYLDHADQYFSIGEHDFFVTSKINDKISFLGEYVIRFNGNSATSFLPSIERSLVKFNYYKNHNLIFGKIHSPVNYWNDVYHHGRLFFPVIDRPTSFSYLVPLHTLGLQLQGQNIGESNFGYDIVLGNGISSSDVFNDNLDLSLTAAFHFKPKEGMRIGASYYYDFLEKNISGVHSGHSAPRSHYTGTLYKGALNYHLLSFSFANFNSKYELLNEFTYNATKTDTLGLANNFSNFLYAGVRIKEKHVPYLLVDYMNIDKKDLHTYEYMINKFALGYKHEFSHLINVKVQAEYLNFMKQSPQHTMSNRYGLRVQLAYGF